MKKSLSIAVLGLVVICSILAISSHLNNKNNVSNNALAQNSLLEMTNDATLLCEVPAEQFQMRDYIEMQCNVCRGSGKCTYCKGSGYSHTNLYTGKKVVCSACSGSGLCYKCGGRGKVRLPR